jgi:hypothetical protein
VIPNVFAVVGDPIGLALVASQPAKRQPHWVRFSSQHDGAKFLTGLVERGLPPLMVRGVRQAAQLIEECESFGLATTMVIPSGLALDVQGAAFVKGFRGVDFVISGRARITARQDRDLANNLLGMEPSVGQVLSITSS